MPDHSNKQPEIYISYAWGDDENPDGVLRGEMVDKFVAELEEKKFNLKIDREENRYKDSIRDFMNEIGESDYVIVILSAKYLNSNYCMYEAVEILKNKDYRERIFPIILPDAKIDNAVDRAKLVISWEEKHEELREVSEKIKKKEYAKSILKEQELFSEIIRIIAEFTDEIADMLTIRPKQISAVDFSPIYEAIDQKIKDDSNDHTSNQPPNSTGIEGDLPEAPKTIFENKLSLKNTLTRLFTGRKGKLDDITSAYNDCDIFSITGIGGIGKTELLLKFLDGLTADEKNEVTFQDITTSLLFDNFITAAGFGVIIQSNKTDVEKFGALVDKLNEYKRLVVWDNLHECNDDTFMKFIAFAEGKLHSSKLIILSRTNPQESLKNIELTDFKESFEYTKKLISDWYPALTISDTDIKRIGDYVKGHPLAIQLTLNLCTSFPIEHVIGHLSDPRHSLDGLSQRLFAKVLEQESTDPEEKKFLFEFSIFKNPIPLEGIMAVLGEAHLFKTIKSLRGKYLLEYNSSTQLYDTHPLIREFCYKRLTNQKELHEKAAEYFMTGRTEDLDLNLEEKIFHHHKEAEAYPSIADTIHLYGRDYERKAYHNPLLEIIAVLRNNNITHPLFDILEGDILRIRGDYKQACKLFRNAKKNSLDDELAIEAELNELDTLKDNVKEKEDVLISLYKIRDHATNQGFNKYLAWTLNNIAGIKKDLMQFDKAFDLYREATEITEKLAVIDKNQQYSKQVDLATLYNNIGTIYDKEGFPNYNLNQALEYHKKSLKIQLEIGNKGGIADSYNNIGSIYKEKDFPDFSLNQALEYQKKSLKINLDIGNKEGIAKSYNNIGFIHGKKDFPDYSLNHALEYYQKSLKINLDIEYKEMIASSYINIAAIYGNKDFHDYNVNQAIEYYQKSSEIHLEIGAKENVSISYYNIGSIHFEKEDYKESLLFVLNSYAITKKINPQNNVKDEIQLINHIRKVVSKNQFNAYFEEAIPQIDSEYREEIDIADFEHSPVKSSKTYGRNDRVTVKYADERIETKKFKSVEKDLEEGICEIVE